MELDASWPGVVEAGPFSKGLVDEINRLADLAKAGKWEEVFSLLDAESRITANQWRVGGDSWFTPLHQAAWLGASPWVVDELIRRGAWRSVRTAKGERPIDIALRRNHHHLIEALAVDAPSDYEVRKLAAWDKHLSELIRERTKFLDPVKTRPVPTEVIVLEPLENLYFAYPGMYGGFSMSTFRGRLFAESWSRVVGGQARLTS